MGGFHELWMFSLTYDIPDLNAKELVSSSYWPKYSHFQQQAIQVDKKYFFSFFQMYLFLVRRKTDPCLTTQSGSKPFQFSKELPLSQLRIQSELFSKLTETFNLSFNIPLTTALCHRTWVWGLGPCNCAAHYPLYPHCRPLRAWTWNLKLNWPLLSLAAKGRTLNCAVLWPRKIEDDCAWSNCSPPM